MSKKNFSLLLFAFSLVTYEGTTYAANDMIMPGMLSVVHEFNYPVTFVALSLSLYLLGNAMLQLFLGPLAERFGKRRVILVGNASFLLFTAFIALSVNMHMFLLGRLLQGSGLAFIAMGYALIHENFNDKNAVRITSIMANISVLAPIVGPIVGGVITSYVSWRYVFVCSLVTGTLSLVGLYQFAPSNKTPLQRLGVFEIIAVYVSILKNPIFALGAVSVGIMVMPSMLWIGISPTLVMHTLHLPMSKYMEYQVLAIGGFMISTILNQVLAGRVAMMKLVKLGILTSALGLIISAIFYTNILVIAIGMGISCIGLGLQMGTMFRIVGKLEVKSQSMLFSLMAFIQITLMTVFLELSNDILNWFNYSLTSFVIAVLIFGLLAITLVTRFVVMNKNRNWQ
jgi:DHA1 family multidrug/chloramphenicol efflux transport protein-like MFS transporter